MSIRFRRPNGGEKVLMESVSMMLACAFELLEYGSQHRVGPWKCACLLACSEPETISRIMQELKDEWEMVLSMEQDKEQRVLLHQHCRWILHQSVRELFTSCEQNRFSLNGSLKAMIASWHPCLQSSANIESLFNDCQSAVQRSGRADTGSISGLMCVAIRSLMHRMGQDPESGRPVELEPADFEGCEIPALKSKLWTPSSAPNCTSPARCIF